MKYAGQVKFSLLNNDYYFFVSEDVYLIIQNMVEKIDTMYVEENQKIYLDEIRELESEQIIEVQERRKKIVKTIKCKVIGDYFDVTRHLIENNIPIVQEYDFTNDQTTHPIDI